MAVTADEEVDRCRARCLLVCKQWSTHSSSSRACAYLRVGPDGHVLVLDRSHAGVAHVHATCSTEKVAGAVVPGGTLYLDTGSPLTPIRLGATLRFEA